MSETSGTPGGGAVFERKATGLVREGRTRDALFYNVMWASVGLTFAFFWLFYGSYSGANAIVGFLIAAALGLPGAFLYAMLTQVMPRTGGDYVFNSRALHPAVGFAASFSFCFWLIIVMGVYTTYVAEYGFAALARTIAGYTGATGWLDVANWLTTSWGLFIVGTALLLLSAVLFALGGIRLFFRVQAWGFALYVLGALVLPALIGYLGGDFSGHLDAYAANLGVADASTRLAESAAAAGHESSGFSWGATIKSVSLWWFIFGFIYSSNYFAGEIRQKRRTHLLSIPGAVALVVVILLVITPAFVKMVGYDVAGQFSLADPASYGFAGAPGYAEVMAIASGSPVLGVLIVFGFTVGLVVWLPQTILLVSRSMFAWSFDRVVPQQLSHVESRTRSPVVAIAVMTTLCVGSTAMFAFTDWFSPLAAPFGQTLFTLLITALSGTILAFRHPRLVASTSYGRRILGIPLLSVVGALAVLGFGGAVAILLIDPNSGVSLANDPAKLATAVAVYVVGVLIYLSSRVLRKRQGYDLDLAYRELPAE